MHALLNLIALIVVFGVGLWAINVFIPMSSAVKSLLNALILIVLIIYILQFFNIIHSILPMANILK